jgi:Tfp pilus assembly protein PilW
MTQRNESGFSLLELMMAALMTIGLIGGIFAISNQSQRVFGTESGVVDMNQGIRTAMDMLTRDVQSAGTGLPWGTRNFPAVFYSSGSSGAPDSLLLMNGDPFAPTADVWLRDSATSTLTLIPPPDVSPLPVAGLTQLYTYTGYHNQGQTIYRTYSTADPRQYVIYDDNKIAIFRLTANGTAATVAGSTKLNLRYDSAPGNYKTPADLFATAAGGSVIDLGQPDYTKALKVAVLGSTVAYRLDTDTQELMRTEDLQNWYPVARGILDFQVTFRVVRLTAGGAIEEKVTTTPGDGTDRAPSGEATARSEIHSAIVTLVAETPDVEPSNPRYRRVTSSFEITPRNLNLLDNNNLR